MGYTEIATAALEHAEQQLRRAIEEALRVGAYRDVSILAEAADDIADWRNRILAELRPVPTPNAGEEPEPTESVVRTPQLPRQARTARSTRRSQDQFPKFLRDGVKLVKVAWSKKEKKTYEHRAPRETVDAVIGAIKANKGEGRRFETAEIMPVRQADGRDYPSYQSYMALAWLRHVGVVTKDGRDGYVLKPDMATADHIKALWDALPRME